VEGSTEGTSKLVAGMQGCPKWPPKMAAQSDGSKWRLKMAAQDDRLKLAATIGRQRWAARKDKWRPSNCGVAGI